MTPTQVSTNGLGSGQAQPAQHQPGPSRRAAVGLPAAPRGGGGGHPALKLAVAGAVVHHHRSARARKAAAQQSPAERPSAAQSAPPTPSRPSTAPTVSRPPSAPPAPQAEAPGFKSKQQWRRGFAVDPAAAHVEAHATVGGWHALPTRKGKR